MKKLTYLFLILSIVSCKKDDDPTTQEPNVNKEFYITFTEDGEKKTTYGANAEYGDLNGSKVLRFNTNTNPLRYGYEVVIFDIESFDSIKPQAFYLNNDVNIRCGAKLCQLGVKQSDFHRIAITPASNNVRVFIDSVYAYAADAKVIMGRVENIVESWYSLKDIQFKLIVENTPNLGAVKHKDEIEGFISARVDGEVVKQDIAQVYNSGVGYIPSSTYSITSTSPRSYLDYDEPGFTFLHNGINTGTFKNYAMTYSRVEEDCKLIKYQGVKDSFNINIDEVEMISTNTIRMRGSFYGVMKKFQKRIEIENGEFEFTHTK